MKRVVCFGSAVVDVMVKSKDFRVLKSHQVSGGVALCEVYGGKTEVEGMKVVVGGSGTNVAAGLSRLGVATATVVRVGDDSWGEMVFQDLRKEGVEESLVQVDRGGQTGMSVVLVAADGGRSILTYRGVSKEIKAEEVDWEKLAAADWIQIGTLGGEFSLVEDVISWAASKKIDLGWNPGRKELEQRTRALKLLPLVKLLVVNRQEAAALVGGLREDGQMASDLSNRGVRMVVITAGKDGAGAMEAGVWRKMDAFEVKSADDTGAGDAFVGGLVAGLVAGWEVERALKLGMANGASEVTKMGVKEGLLYKSEVEKWLKKPVKVIEEKL